MKLHLRGLIAAFIAPIFVSSPWAVISIMSGHYGGDSIESRNIAFDKWVNIDAAIFIIFYIPFLIMGLFILFVLLKFKILYVTNILIFSTLVAAAAGAALYFVIQLPIYGALLAMGVFGVWAIGFSVLAGVPLTKPRSPKLKATLGQPEV